MNDYIAEIYRILNQLPLKRCSEEKKRKCIDNLFCRCEGYDNEVIEYYRNNKRIVTEYLKPVIGYVAADCSKRNCKKCILAKWCFKNRYNLEKKIDLEAPVFADFFCGAGGLSIGFKRAGFKLSLANDIQKCCVETYRFNSPETPASNIVCGDINDVLDRIECLTRFKQVDVVIGGPPCQGFSMANRQRLIDDPRNKLYKSFIKAVSILQPKFVVMENVRGILEYKEQIYRDYNEIGYEVSARILNSSDFGVPQNRIRTIFIANRIGADNDRIFELIEEKCRELPKTVLNDAIKDLPKLRARTEKNNYVDNDISGRTVAYHLYKQTDYMRHINDSGMTAPLLFNHKARFNNARDIEIYSRMNPGDNSTDEKIADIMPYSRRNAIFKDKYYKLKKNEVCKTITAHMRFDCNMYIHPEQARGLTPREAARVQTFPDDYYFRGAYTTTYMQIGNSVPPLMSYVIADAIKKSL